MSEPPRPAALATVKPASASSGAIVNAMTVDVEDYFQVSAFDRVVPRARWDALESRVSRNTDRVLELFDRANVRGTFFVLGWVAERFPSLVRRIADLGHEVASHGYNHQLVYLLTPSQFREDVRSAKHAIENAAGVEVVGFRAPSYSVIDSSLWTLDVLIEEGFAYDASIFPIHHDRYGIPDSPQTSVRAANGPAGPSWKCRDRPSGSGASICRSAAAATSGSFRTRGRSGASTASTASSVNPSRFIRIPGNSIRTSRACR